MDQVMSPKRTASSESGDENTQPSPKKAARLNSVTDPSSSWCSACWAHPKRCCTGKDHPLLSVDDAEREARAAVGDAQKALERCQDRHHVVYKAFLEMPEIEPLIIVATVYYEMISYKTIVVDKDTHDLPIVLSPIIGGLTDEEKESVTEAIKSAQLKCRYGNDRRPVAALGALRMQEKFERVLEKFPKCVESQELPPGTVVVYESTDNYVIYDKPVVTQKYHEKRGGRILGQMMKEVEDLREVTNKMVGERNYYDFRKTKFTSARFVDKDSVKLVKPKAFNSDQYD
ncbi:uncharacterized protein LOC113212024 isoform X3 [Frankliniella occidentalis]|uniref:Uncharacterized protein LOC113212024 isoform X3 n=1 Tax=Frankliniella occidentalis TaxID=133901 RepID=A0A9C6U826_FRAOC|nr:uncharacterized protein LOC113212024 isoform X3 [Frankliniella occidentalis]XP_052122925.1 uncharacterized protein LOC113212024 isoform X3 [Frankliniella occidentalis]